MVWAPSGGHVAPDTDTSQGNDSHDQEKFGQARVIAREISRHTAPYARQAQTQGPTVRDVSMKASETRIAPSDRLSAPSQEGRR
ncbi:hypothetical protein GCM10010468_14560 [Actinocorallia longicatena]|uniref:Uncharacterized protein n=1 Tax=Actinocorallia longicatena TaxID=111803 RepID=A0ABP6Q346_9ACTN